MYALVTSIEAALIDTPGLRRTITDIHPQLYVFHQLTFVNLSVFPCSAPYVVIGINAAGGLSAQSPTNPRGDTPMTV